MSVSLPRSIKRTPRQQAHSSTASSKAAGRSILPFDPALYCQHCAGGGKEAAAAKAKAGGWRCGWNSVMFRKTTVTGGIDPPSQVTVLILIIFSGHFADGNLSFHLSNIKCAVCGNCNQCCSCIVTFRTRQCIIYNDRQVYTYSKIFSQTFWLFWPPSK